MPGFFLCLFYCAKTKKGGVCSVPACADPAGQNRRNNGKGKEKYSFGGYRYAPESIKFMLNGKLLHLPEELRSMLAYKAVCGRTKEVVDELKRFVRQRRRESDIAGFTYGFFADGRNDYYFTRELITTDCRLSEKVRVYKAWKKYLADNGCIVELPYSVWKGEVTPDGMQGTGSSPVTVRVDLKRPVTVRFKTEGSVYGNDNYYCGALG